MRYIFVDESRITQSRYQLFGSLWLPREKQEEFRNKFWDLWDKKFASRKSELKWTKVSKNKLNSYEMFIRLFSLNPYLDFRCLVLDKHAVDYKEYHGGDEELGFYKFLYFFISRNLEKDYKFRGIKENFYQIFMHRRRMGDKAEWGRLSDLKKVLNNRLWKSCFYNDFNNRSGIKFPSHQDLLGKPIRNIEPVDSHYCPEVQLVDVLTGAVGYAWDGFQTSPAKLDFIEYVENLFGLRLNQETPYLSEKINIWKFKLKEKQKSASYPTPR
ncbi:MAG: DUF3800 domain-containing protein [Patescibacteria group bacterium]